MEWSIVFMGPVGSGKTCAIHTISDVDAAGTEARPTDETIHLKSTTTVSMDVGVLNLGDEDKVRLIGAPGQDRFDFMWDILLEQVNAVIILIDHSRETRLVDLDKFIAEVALRSRGRRFPLAIGITHFDMMQSLPLKIYRERLEQQPPSFASGLVPIFSVDAREKHDVRALVVSVAAILEMEMRFATPT